MRKILTFLIIAIFVLGVKSMSVKAEFMVTPTSTETTYIDGVEHTKIIGTIENDSGVITNQVINYLGGNPTTNPNLHVISGDAYVPLSYSTATLPNIIQDVNVTFDHYEVIGGVNADYFNMVVGIPVEAYIRNFEVLSSGLGYNRTVIGFKDNGEVVTGRPCFEGVELIIYNSDGDIKHRVPVERINKLPFSDLGTTVFFSDYTQDITTALPKLIIDTIEFKTDNYQTRYFGKGTYEQRTTEEMSVPTGKFVVVSNDPYIKDLLVPDDIVLVQEKVGCGFEDARFAVGAWEHLVENGVATSYLETGTYIDYASPRTAIGIKANGTVFFVTVDGRQSASGMDGLNLYEMADLMVAFGAKTAFAFDGGGSTTMAVTDGEGGYDITNSPSDGGLRRLSNAVLFVKGNHPARPETLLLPDLSVPLSLPGKIYIDDEGVLRFDKVQNALQYEVNINGEPYLTNSRDVSLNFPIGEYQIKVRTIGDGLYFSNSAYSEIITFNVYKESEQSIIELFRNYAKSEIK